MHEVQQTKTQFIDFTFGQDNGQGREPVKILREELQIKECIICLSISVQS